MAKATKRKLPTILYDQFNYFFHFLFFIIILLTNNQQPTTNNNCRALFRICNCAFTSGVLRLSMIQLIETKRQDIYHYLIFVILIKANWSWRAYLKNKNKSGLGYSNLWLSLRSSFTCCDLQLQESFRINFIFLLAAGE